MVAITMRESPVPEAMQKDKPCGQASLEAQRAAEMLVGSQKRKARKNKITHLVRTADGRLSPAEGKCCLQPSTPYHIHTFPFFIDWLA